MRYFITVLLLFTLSTHAQTYTTKQLSDSMRVVRKRLDQKDIRDDDRNKQLAYLGQRDSLIFWQSARLKDRLDSVVADTVLKAKKILSLQQQVTSLSTALDNQLKAQAVINTQQAQTNLTLALLTGQAGKKISLSGMPGEIAITKLSDSSYVIGLVTPGQFLLPQKRTKKRK